MLRVRTGTKDVEIDLEGHARRTIEIKQRIERELEIPPTQQRLIVKGKILGDDDLIFPSTQAALHILPPESAIQDMLAREAEAKRIHDIKASRRVVSIQARNEQLNARAYASTTYKFHAIETLPNLPDEAIARNILETLAQDPGILAVLAKHKWQVGALAEMFPDGKVGVDPVCVLGLNENKGQRILLRLRTDDLQGFRKYLNIKNVLYHELSHNDVSDHNSEFYQLMRQVENECNAVPMTTTKPKEMRLAQPPQPSSHRLSSSARELSISESISHLPPSTSPQLPASPERVVQPVEEPKQEPLLPPPSLPAPVVTSNVLQPEIPEPITSDIDASPSIPQEQTQEQTQQQESPLAPLADWDDMALAMGGERVQLVHSAIHALHTALQTEPFSDREATVNTLKKLLENILNAPHEAKFKSVRKENPRIQKTLGKQWQPCSEFLRSVGFQEDATHWNLTREDPGLLWLGKAALEALL
ncbi:hypothetical protein LEN26_018438 [Aphanomyces euteiches]|nr:hypothetical protein LEN26_018438 [Aphanomyces euteiches]KAH9126181.1 hypothetical protein AeMF1_003368 [Aphanomyces euteiches]KAH9189935.1 hypothetical protein AeNC1_008094 [Aphanomyces euteiches]